MLFRKKNEATEEPTPVPRSKIKRAIGIVISIFLITLGIFFLMRIFVPINPNGQGALQITTNIKSTIYLNGQFIGSTPLCKGYSLAGCDAQETIPTGEYLIKIIPDDKTFQPYLLKAKIQSGVLTAIERTFLPGAYASSYVLNLDKIDSSHSELLVTSIPDGAMVTLDSSPQGITPFLLKNITASEHELEVQKPGYGKKLMKIRAVKGYRLIAKVVLGTQSQITDSLPSPTSSDIPPTPSLISSPTIDGKQVLIKPTSTGFLRVRSSPGGSEIAQVLPGESYPYINESNGWYQIKLTSTGQEGWVSSRFAEIRE